MKKDSHFVAFAFVLSLVAMVGFMGFFVACEKATKSPAPADEPAAMTVDATPVVTPPAAPVDEMKVEANLLDPMAEMSMDATPVVSAPAAK